MLATLRPSALMDPYQQYQNISDVNSLNRLPTSQPTASRQSQIPLGSSFQVQQQLPSFKEILPPPLHSAIESAPQTSPQNGAGDTLPIQHQTQTHPVPSNLSSPVYQPATSMPDNFDEFRPQNQEHLYQLSAHPRQNSTWSASSQYSDMATSFGAQRPSYPNQSMSGSRPSPGLPPLRDINLESKFNSYESQPLYGNMNYAINNGAPRYNMQLENSPYTVRGQQFPEATPRYSATYPQTNRPYPQQQDRFASQYGASSDPYFSRSPQMYGNASAEYQTSMNGGPLHVPSSAPYGMEQDHRSRRRRGNLPKPITDILKNWFYSHVHHPYPTEEEKQMLINQTGLSMNQISNWFINARRRQLPALRQKDKTANLNGEHESDR